MTPFARSHAPYKEGEAIVHEGAAYIVTRAWSQRVEDGRSFHMDFEEGTVYCAEARPAEEGEAPTATAIARTLRAAEALARTPFTWRETRFPEPVPLPDGTTKPEPGTLRMADLAALPAYTTVPPHLLGLDREAHPGWGDHVRVNAAAGVAYTMHSMLWAGEVSMYTANIAESTDEIRIGGARFEGHGRWEVLAHEITPRRAEWIAQVEQYLRTGDVAFQAMGIGAAGARALREAGWTTWDVACARKAFRLDDDTAADAAAHPPAWWAARGWWERAGWTGYSPRPELLTAAEAAALAEQGIDGRAEGRRRWEALRAARNT